MVQIHSPRPILSCNHQLMERELLVQSQELCTLNPFAAPEGSSFGMSNM